MTTLLGLLKTHHNFLVLLVFAGLLFLSDIRTYKEFVRAESYFALGARLMLDNNQWIAPHAPDEPQLNKPPLTYWLMGVSYKLFGVGYGPARLPLAISALAVLTIVYFLGLQLFEKRTALTSAAVLASSYLFFSFARMAMSDMLLTLCVTGSLASFILALSGGLGRFQQVALVGYVLLAFGFLTKGPVAFALIALPIVCELAISRNRDDLKRLRIVVGLSLLVLIIAPYFLMVYMRFGVEPFHSFFLRENFQRFTGTVYGFGTRPVSHKIAAFFSDFAPWSLLIFLAVWHDRRKRQTAPVERRAIRLLYLWLFSTILFFTVSSFMRDYYLLPAMPGAALIVGRLLANVDAFRIRERRIIKAYILLLSLVLSLAGILSIQVAKALSLHVPLSFLPVAVALAGTSVIIVCLVRGKVWLSAMVLAAAIGMMILTVQWTLTPAFAAYLPAVRLAANVPANRVLYTSWAANGWANCLAFNLTQGRVERLTGDTNNAKLQDVLRNDSHAVALVEESEYHDLLKKGPPLRIISEGDTFGRGGLNWNMLRHPRLQRLFLVVSDE